MSSAPTRAQPRHEHDAPIEQVPPLEPGDRLTRAEFERRYSAMPHVKKAELLEGVVYMPSPARLRRHGEPHVLLSTWLGNYRAATPGVIAADNATARLDLDNEPQPDLLLMIDPAKGGQARISDDDYVENAPELICEIAASSASYDLHVKKNVYRRCGVREYIVWRVLDGAIDWLVLREGEYHVLTPDDRGLFKSETFPGLWLDAIALLEGNLARVLAVLNEGLATPDHAVFAAKLTA